MLTKPQHGSGRAQFGEHKSWVFALPAPKFQSLERFLAVTTFYQPTSPQQTTMGAKKDAKKAREAQAQQKAQGGGDSKGRGQQKQPKQRNDIVPWGWEQSAKDERRKKVAERQAADAAARNAKEAADNFETAKIVKKQPGASDAKPTGKADAKP